MSLAGTYPLVGREPELAALSRAISDPTGCAWIAGEAGVGKTRLLQEVLAARGDPQRVLAGYCFPLREPFPLGPVIDALRRAAPFLREGPLDPIAGVLRPLLPELAERLPPEPDGVAPFRTRKYLLFRAVREILGAVAPAILVLEDLHWADELTTDLAVFLATRPVEGVRAVFTFRRDGVPPEIPGALARQGARGVELVPLGPEHTRALAEEILGEPRVSASVGRLLHERTSGLPFSIAELVPMLRERGDLVARGGAWRCSHDRLCADALPRAVRDAVQALVGSLGHDALLTLHAASVFGTPFDDALLFATAGLPAARGGHALVELERRSVLEPDDAGRYRFRHALTRQTVYESLSASERRRLHRRAARVLSERGGSLPRIAHHEREAGREAAWARAAEAGARAALESGEDLVAARLLQPLLETASLARARRGRLAKDLARAALNGLAHEEAITVIERIVGDEELARGDRGELRVWLGRLRMQSGDAASSHRETAAAVADLGRRPALAAQAMAALAIPTTADVPVDERREWAARAGRLLARLPERAERARAEHDLLMASIMRGEGTPARILERLSLREGTVDERREFIRGRTNASRALLCIGMYGAAETLAKEARRIAEDPAFGRVRGYVESTEILLDFFAGRWAGLRDRVSALREDVDLAHVEAEAELVLALLLLAEGVTSEADRRLMRVVPVLERAGSLPLALLGLAAQGRLRLASGDQRGAREAADISLDLLRRTDLWASGGEATVGIVHTLLSTGAGDAGRDVVSEATTALAGRTAPGARAALRSCEALIALDDDDLPAAATAFRRAGEAWGRLPRPLSTAMCLRYLGEVTLGLDMAEGEAHLRSALQAFEAMGARWEADQVRQTLRDAGIAAPTRWRGGRRGYGSELSPRERDVARHVARGLTNKEIADLLFLSPRTVGHHVSRAMRKLGVSSRSALAVAAMARGPEED